MDDLIITKQLRDALVTYLVNRPFREVADAVMALQQLPPVPVEKPAASKTTKRKT